LPLRKGQRQLPWLCGRYVDSNADYICDRSEPEPSILTTTTFKPSAETITDVPHASAEVRPPRPSFSEKYPFLPVSAVLVAAYVLSHLLSKRGTVSVVAYRWFWNVLLLLTFLVTAISGVLFVIRINYGVVVPLPGNTLFWHVETGIAMTLISVFHILGTRTTGRAL